MAEFFESDVEYVEWIEALPSGFILNLRKSLSPEYVAAHSARCGLISRKNVASGAFTERSYRKVGASLLADLSAWVKQELRPDGSFTKLYPWLGKYL